MGGASTAAPTAPDKQYRLWLVWRGSTTPSDWWDDVLAADTHYSTPLPGIFAKNKPVGFAHGFMSKFLAVTKQMREGSEKVVVNPDVSACFLSKSGADVVSGNCCVAEEGCCAGDEDAGSATGRAAVESATGANSGPTPDAGRVSSDKVYAVLAAYMRLRKISSFEDVAVAGHSLGGSLAEMTHLMMNYSFDFAPLAGGKSETQLKAFRYTEGLFRLALGLAPVTFARTVGGNEEKIDPSKIQTFLFEPAPALQLAGRNSDINHDDVVVAAAVELQSDRSSLLWKYGVGGIPEGAGGSDPIPNKAASVSDPIPNKAGGSDPIPNKAFRDRISSDAVVVVDDSGVGGVGGVSDAFSGAVMDGGGAAASSQSFLSTTVEQEVSPAQKLVSTQPRASTPGNFSAPTSASATTQGSTQPTQGLTFFIFDNDPTPRFVGWLPIFGRIPLFGAIFRKIIPARFGANLFHPPVADLLAVYSDPESAKNYGVSPVVVEEAWSSTLHTDRVSTEWLTKNSRFRRPHPPKYHNLKIFRLIGGREQGPLLPASGADTTSPGTDTTASPGTDTTASPGTDTTSPGTETSWELGAANPSANRLVMSQATLFGGGHGFRTTDHVSAFDAIKDTLGELLGVERG